MKPLTLKLAAVATLLMLCRTASLGAPFAEEMPFTQPDGRQIRLWGQGDEFHAVFETLDGYTVEFNQQTKAYDYARLSDDGNQLVSTGVAVGQGDPAALGLKQHLRINPAAVRSQAAERFQRWDQAMGITRRWNDLKTEQRLAELSAAQEDGEPAPPSSTTTGQKLGLTLLIDFSDAAGTIAQAEIFNFCNGDNYTSDGNNGSVKKYFLDNSNNQLTYSNVVTIYIRVPQPKSYYNDTAVTCGTQGRLLITDAINAMKALTNYTTAILPTFSGLTVDPSSRVVACNVFFAGGNSGVWNYGLWPHSWSLASSIDLGNGKKVYKYQITNIGTSLALGTFCHENGHMLCGYPDIYDYDYDSYGGAGRFCLMGYGGSGGNPVQICAYLKRASGWAATTELTSSSILTASVASAGTGFNKFFRYVKPGVSTEYFLVENRQKSGRDANLPASGIAVWHIDELGDKDNQSTNFNTSHLNYEVSLMQADNLWHFQDYLNSGDSKDLYYLGNTATGYANRFSDATSPSARWWNGSSSGIDFHHFSAGGTTMTFGVGPEGPVIVVDSASLATEGCMPTNGVVDPNETVSVNFALKNTGSRNTSNLVATLQAANGVTLPSSPQTYGVLVTNGAAVTRPFTFTATGACGGVLTAVLQLQDGANNLGTVTNNFILGAPGGSPVAANYSSGGSAATISDNATVDVPISITDAGTITDVNVRVRLNHTYDGDLVLSLVHPDGTVIALANNRGGSGDNFGSGASSCSGTFSVFDDSAGTAISSGSAPFAGSYRSEDLLSTLNGKPVTGTWNLRVADTAGADTGTIYCFQLDISRQLFACCTVSTDLEVALTASPNPVPAGQNLTYTLAVTNLGPEPASSVTLTNSLPASVSFVSASPGCVNQGGEVVATVGTLSSGGSSNFTVVVTPNFGGLITNILTVASFTTDTNSANNAATNITTVNAPPIITVQPSGRNVNAGTNVTFQVTAVGTAPMAYQWLFDGTNLAGAASSTLTLTNVLAAQAGIYTVLVTNEFGSFLSSNALLTVQDPWIIGQPQNQSVTAGAPASFTVSAVGTPTLSYQWLKGGIVLVDGTNLSGAQTASLTVAPVQVSDLGSYSVAVSNLNGQVVSSNATLTGDFPPVILTQPASQAVLAGSVASFTAGVAGSGPMGFQWRRAGTNLVDGSNISGSASASLIVSNAQGFEMGNYALVVTNAYGSMTSSNALLALWPLVAWGRSNYNQANVPGGLSNVLGVAGGLYHSLALRADGTVAAWGAGTTNTGVSPHQGQAIVPGNLSNAIQVVGGYYHSLALKADGTMVVWGAGTNDTGAIPHFGQAMVPAGLSNVVALAAGAYHSLALKPDRRLVAWGAGTTNTGSSPYLGQAGVPVGLSSVVGVAAGAYHSLALKSDGTVVAWGAGATNTGSSPHYGQAMVPDGLSNVVAVAAGGYHSVALKSDGTVVAWGDTTYGQTNTPASLSNVVAIAAGRYDSLALQSDGAMVAWGDNAYGQTNPPVGLANVVGIAGGGFHALALAGDGSPYITVQPLGQTVLAGAAVRFLAMAAGLPPLGYQWQRNGTNLAGATTNSLTLANVQYSDTGVYTLLVSNSLGSTLSSVAALTINDTTPLVLVCATNKTVECGSAWSFDPPEASDACGGTNVIVTLLGVETNGACPAVITATWEAVDNCGNTNTCSQSVTNVDLTPPVLVCATNKTVECGTAWDFDPPAASDACSGTNVAVTLLGVETNGACPAVMTATWEAVDTCGNTNTCSQTVTNVDLTPPVLVCATNKTVECGTAWTFDPPAASDACSGTNVAVTLLGVETNGACPAVMTATWEAVDTCGNTNTCSQTVTNADTTPPVLVCATNKTVECGTAWDFDPPAASDACSGTNVAVTLLGVETNGACPAVMTATWEAVDNCGNTNTCSQTVTNVDLTPPVLVCATNKTVECGTAWDFDPPAASDVCSGTNVIVTLLGVETNGVCPAVITATWEAVDACGNTNTCSQNVTNVDLTPPIILTFGPSEWLPDIGLRLTLLGNVTGSITIQWTEELTNPASNWLPLTNLTGFTGSTQYLDSEATNFGLRFYRAVAP